MQTAWLEILLGIRSSHFFSMFELGIAQEQEQELMR